MIRTDMLDFDAVVVEKDVSTFSHFDLKQLAKQILEERGFKVKIGGVRGELYGRFDVLAEKENVEVNVECGETPLRRIFHNLKVFDEVWHIPYQEKTCYVYIYKKGKHFWDLRKLEDSDIMVKCLQCNKPNLPFPYSRFCGNCGNPLSANLPIYCTTCGQKLPEKLVRPRKEEG